MQMTNRHAKRCSAPLVTRETQNHSEILLQPVKLNKQKSDDHKDWLACGATAAAAAAAKSLQLCPTLCDPTDGSPPGSSIHGIFQARVLEWSAIAFSPRRSTFL